MGARAHGRRHEGRKIRKVRRQMREAVRAFAVAGAAMGGMSRTMEGFVRGLQPLVDGLKALLIEDYLNKLAQEGLDVPALALAGVDPLSPTQSGVTALKSAFRGFSADEAYVDEFQVSSEQDRTGEDDG